MKRNMEKSQRIVLKKVRKDISTLALIEIYDKGDNQVCEDARKVEPWRIHFEKTLTKHKENSAKEMSKEPSKNKHTQKIRLKRKLS